MNALKSIEFSAPVWSQIKRLLSPIHGEWLLVEVKGNHKRQAPPNSVRTCSHCSPCSTIIKKWTVRTVRCLHCSYNVNCSHCSPFGLFGQCELFALFVVRTVRTIWTVRTVRRSHCSHNVNCSHCSLRGQMHVVRFLIYWLSEIQGHVTSTLRIDTFGSFSISFNCQWCSCR